jgi:hypothetical protein
VENFLWKWLWTCNTDCGMNKLIDEYLNWCSFLTSCPALCILILSLDSLCLRSVYIN